MRASDAARKGGEELSVLASRLDEEASWGLEWLLKTSFKDGYHIEWNTQRIYSDNKIGTLDDVVTKATFNPWENYLGAAVMLTATDHLQEFKDGKDKLVSTAMDLWDSSISKDNGLNVILEASWGAIASVRLYSLLGDEKYRNAALRFGEILTDCQETSFVDGIPITGYFYTSPDRRKLVHYYHAAFHEAPVIALRELCDAFPEEDQWSRWIAALAIHSECYLKRGASISAPYNLLPAGIYRKSDIPADIDGRENYYKTQYEAGTPLGENHAMRAFPIWEDHIFHGSTTCDLSNAWALAEASVILGDKEGLDIVQEQLEWLLGRNPFNQSLVYGVGHDYAPLFEYCTSNVTGAIPVGIDSFNDDTPFWNGTACATSKEMWIETANRFMGTVATMVGSEAAEQPVRVSVATEDSLATATLSGKGRHTLEVRTFNAECGLKKTEVRLRRGKDVSLTFNLKATDKNKPYVAALILDGDTSHPIVITGY